MKLSPLEDGKLSVSLEDRADTLIFGAAVSQTGRTYWARRRAGLAVLPLVTFADDHNYPIVFAYSREFLAECAEALGRLGVESSATNIPWPFSADTVPEPHVFEDIKDLFDQQLAESAT